MINKELMLIKYVKMIAQDTIEMVLENDYISKTAIPGQFVHILIDGNTLRRPISIADINREEKTITILFKVVGSGTRKLASYKPGMVVDALGPGGNGFKTNLDNQSTILLIGGGIGVPPLYFLGKSLANKGKIISILGFQSEENVFYEDKFRALGETFIVTNDGSYGEEGFVTDVLEKAGYFDRYFSCGPLPMLQAITAKLPTKPGLISLEERMGCGVGACMACVIPSSEKGGYRKICSDGPVFEAQEVIL